MRMKLYFMLKKNSINIDFRPSIVSFFKKALSENDPDMYQKLYNKGSAVQKDFTYSIFLPGPTFKENQIELNESFINIEFSTPHIDHFVKFYNAFTLQKKKPLKLTSNNQMTLNSIQILNEHLIDSNELYVKISSPVLIRKHFRDTKIDKYYIYKDEEFMDAVKDVLKNAIKNNELLCDSMVEDLQILFEPQNSKMVVVKSFGGHFPGTLGIMKLRGDKRLLKYLLEAGLGSRRGEGFGKLEAINGPGRG